MSISLWDKELKSVLFVHKGMMYLESILLVSAKFFYVPKIKVGFLAWNPTFFRYLCFYHKT